jgi:DNA repair protein RecN (Recombination protein N)
LLKQLRIQNLAVVEDVRLEFGPGLNVITGSTGAGKSLILGAVNLLLGKKASQGAIRAGADRAGVECVFEIPHAPGRVGGTITVEREIRRNGRGRAAIDGVTVPLKQLGDLTSQWIEPHGQNEQLRLRNPESHTGFLDACAGNEALLEVYRQALGARTKVKAELDVFDGRIETLKEKEELLRHRLGEIERADLCDGELETLDNSIGLMENAEKIFDAIRFVSAVVDDDERGTAQQLAQSVRRMEKVSELDGRVADFAGRLRDLELSLSDCSADMRVYVEEFEFDPQRLQVMRERRAYLLGLERRYDKSIAGIIEMKARWEQEVDGIQFADEERQSLVDRLGEATRLLQKSAENLTESRRRAAVVLDKSMTRELGGLMMPGARFRTDFGFESSEQGPLVAGDKPVAALPDGADVVRFRVRTNRGESEGPLDEIASTGEISRISLALKKSVQKTPGQAGKSGPGGGVLVFDELDSGVGADLGELIANNLLELGAVYQIICITHMPQIAAAGSRHLVVSKTSTGSRTVVRVEPVTGIKREQEIARMLGGVEGSDNRLALAAEMLDNEKVRP